MAQLQPLSAMVPAHLAPWGRHTVLCTWGTPSSLVQLQILKWSCNLASHSQSWSGNNHLGRLAYPCPRSVPIDYDLCLYLGSAPQSSFLVPHSCSLEAVLPAQGLRGRHVHPCSVVTPANLNPTVDPETAWPASTLLSHSLGPILPTPLRVVSSWWTIRNTPRYSEGASVVPGTLRNMWCHQLLPVSPLFHICANRGT